MAGYYLRTLKPQPTMKPHHSHLLLILLTTGTSQGAFTLVNDFDSGIGSWQVDSSQTSNITNPVTTAAFGSGSNYVDLSDNSTGGFGYESSTNAGFDSLGTSGSLAFEYSPLNTDWSTVSIGSSAFSANRAFSLSSTDLFTNLALQVNSAYQISFLYNISGASITYDDPTIAGSSDGTLADGTAIAYAQLRGSSSFTNSSILTRNGTVALQGLWFTKLGSGTSSTIVDNLQQSSSVEVFVVPEPSTALLGAFGALALLRRRR